MPRIIPEPRYFSMPSIEVGADVRMKRALNCWPWLWSLTHSPDAVIHSPAEIVAAWPMTGPRTRGARAFVREQRRRRFRYFGGGHARQGPPVLPGSMVPAVASFVLPLLAPVPQPDLETCAAIALLVSDAVPASTFDRRPPSRWQPSSNSNPRLP